MTTDQIDARRELGRAGERLAAQFLERRGYLIVVTNFETPVGRDRRGRGVRAEIDLIAYDAATLCFVEVKTRRSAAFALPERSVDWRKQRQIARAARAYRRLFKLTNAPYRFDVVSIVWPLAAGEDAAPPPRVELLRGFWTDAPARRGA